MPSGAEAITADLRKRLSAGEWEVGEQIPPISELCGHYKSSTATMRRAQDPLIAQGWLHAQQGRGVFVAAIPTPKVAAQTSRDMAVTSALAAIDAAITALGEARRALQESSE